MAKIIKRVAFVGTGEEPINGDTLETNATYFAQHLIKMIFNLVNVSSWVMANKKLNRLFVIYYPVMKRSSRLVVQPSTIAPVIHFLLR